MARTFEIRLAQAPTFVFQVGFEVGANVIENYWGVGGQQIQ